MPNNITYNIRNSEQTHSKENPLSATPPSPLPSRRPGHILQQFYVRGGGTSTSIQTMIKLCCLWLGLAMWSVLRRRSNQTDDSFRRRRSLASHKSDAHWTCPRLLSHWGADILRPAHKAARTIYSMKDGYNFGDQKPGNGGILFAFLCRIQLKNSDRWNWRLDVCVCVLHV